MFSKVNQHVEELKRGFSTRGSFTQNLAIVFSGNIIAQLLGFALTPFIARIYGPEAYGIFALVIAIVNNLSPISTLQFPSGFVAAESEQEFYRLVKITLFILFTSTGVYSLIIFLGENYLIALFNLSELKPFAFWMPLYFFLMGLDHLLLGWNIRLKEFKRGAIAKMFSTTVSKGLTILWGLMLQPSALGMIVGNLLGYPFESIVKFGPTIRYGLVQLFKRSLWRELYLTFIKYRGYALFVTPGLFISNFSSQLPVYYFSSVFNGATVGLFALANSLVNMPLALIINSSTTVFLQKAAETILRSQSELKELTLSLYKKLFMVSFLPLVLLAFISEWIFKIVFGEVWQQSGVFVSILCIGAIFSVAHSPLAVLFRLLHFEWINFIFNIFFFGLKFLGLWIGLYYNNIMVAIIGYSIACFVSYLVSLIIIFRIVGLSPWILVRDAILIGIFAVIIIFYNA